MDIPLIQKLVTKFPKVSITIPTDAREILERAGVANLAVRPPNGVEFFEAPHESIKPLALAEAPEENGIHYLNLLTHPGDSHHFHEAKLVLALAIAAPWGSSVDAVRVALELHPKYVIPVHDWHWRDEAREQMYDRLEQRLKDEAIVFLKPKNGIAISLEV